MDAEISAMARAILDACGAVKTGGHFVYASGKHGSMYVDKTAITPRVDDFQHLCGLLARTAHLRCSITPDVVIGAVVVGERMTHPVALEIGHLREMYPAAIWADKKQGAPMSVLTTGAGERLVVPDNLVIGRGFDQYLRGADVLVVEDVVNTGKTVHQLVDLVRRYGGNVMQVAAFCNRGPTKSTDFGEGVDFWALTEVSADAYDPQECQLCKDDVPVNITLGHGAQFLEWKRHCSSQPEA